PFGPDFRRCDPAFRLSRGSNLTRSVSVSGPLSERGPADSLSLLDLSDFIRSSFRSGPHLGELRAVRISIRFPVGGLFTTLAEFLGDA
ncbi:hypothetical protein, partial [Streptomyces noursei]|uniref:hypothetical protein n=1 Tax=Streptomyces noursei TaxID=1971 RepID=UPI0035D94196